MTTVLSPDGTESSVRLVSDPRFRFAAPLVGASTVTLPSGLTRTTTTAREVTLADPADPLSLETLTEFTEVNGRPYVTTFDRAAATFTATTPEGRETTTTLDGQGRVATLQTGTLTPIAFTYDGQGRLSAVSQGARTLSYAYTSRNELASITDPLSRVVDFAYDLAGRVTTQTRPDGEAILFDYDGVGNVTGVTPPGRPAHAFTLTPVDLLETYDPPPVGAPTPTTYSYNLARQPTQVTRPDGQTVTATYDGAGRLDRLTTPTGDLVYTYDAGTGQISEVAAPDATVTYAYDGPLPVQEDWAGTATGAVAWAYDEDFRVTVEQVSGTPAVGFAYDADGLLTDAGALTLTRDAANGFVTDAAVGAVTSMFDYDGFGAVSATETTVVGAPVFAVSYTRDALGRIASQTQTTLGVTRTDASSYDLAGRLTTVTRDGAPLISYTYDANGNRLSETTTAGTVTGTYDAQDRLVTYGAAAYTYTAAGELLARTDPAGTTTYTYDVLGNLRQAALPSGTVVSYAVDGANRRIGRSVNGVPVQAFLYQGQLRPVAELDGAGTLVSRFVYGTGVNVPDYLVRGGTTYRLVTDHLGSVRLVVDAATGAIAQELDYDPFGRVVLDTNPGFQPFAFAGGLYDPLTGLVRFGARDYDAETGRWTAKDPIGFDAGQENLYLYLNGDPVTTLDPTGEIAPWLVAAAAGALTGAVIDVGIQLVQSGGSLGCLGWGSVGTAALSGAALSGLGPTGFLLGRGGARAAQFGYGRSPGLLNRGVVRFGWSGPKNGSDVVSLRVGRMHYDIPGTSVPSGANPIRDGAVAGATAGGANGLLGDSCGCGN